MYPCTAVLNEDYSEKITYDFSEYPIYSRRSLLSTYPNYAAYSHWHEDVEFNVVLSGNMHFNVNGEIKFLEKGSGIFVNARQLHFGFSKQTECDFICLRLHPLLLCSSSAMEQEFIAPLLENQEMPYLKLSKSDIRHQDILKHVTNIHTIKDTPAAPLKIQAAFSAIWADLYESMPKTAGNRKPASGNLTILKNMVAFIQQHYHEKISLAEIAAAGAIGESKCCKLFHSYLNQSPNEYLTSYRLKKSCELLCSTDMTISEVALESGFNSASYYAETFRKCFGESPRSYKIKNLRSAFSTPSASISSVT